jgi:hypothetical protein
MITTGKDLPGRKYLDFRTTFDDANFNQTITRIAKSIYVGDNFSNLTKQDKLDVINKNLIQHLKYLSRNGDVDKAADEARAAAQAAIDSATGIDEELPIPIK